MSATAPGSYSIVVIPAVAPGTKTTATPRSTPASRTIVPTRSVRGWTSPSPSVDMRMWDVNVVKQELPEPRGREKLCSIFRIAYDGPHHNVWVGANHGYAWLNPSYQGSPAYAGDDYDTVEAQYGTYLDAELADIGALL